MSIHAEVTDLGRSGLALLSASAADEHLVHAIIVIPFARLWRYRPNYIASQLHSLSPEIRKELCDRIRIIQQDQVVNAALTIPLAGFRLRSLDAEFDLYQRA